MRLHPSLLTVLLCATLFATSVTQAVARGQMAGFRMVQLCVGGEAVSAIEDAQGKPVDQLHTCPDCIAVTAALPPGAIAPGLPLVGRMHVLLPALAFDRAQTASDACARGPPVLI